MEKEGEKMSRDHFPAVVCNLSAGEQLRCGKLYRSRLFSQVDEIRTREGGYSLRFSWAPERIRDLGEFLTIDSSCCSFFDHSLEIPRGKRLIWLHITGPEEAQAMLTQEVEQLVPPTVAMPIS